MTEQHPITPPPDLVQQWMEKWSVEKRQAFLDDDTAPLNHPYRYIATQAARWGADQELEAVLELLREDQWGMSCTLKEMIAQLRAARRPKPLPEPPAPTCPSGGD